MIAVLEGHALRAPVIAAATCLLVGARCAPPGEGGAGDDVSVEFVFDRHGGLCASPDGGGALCRLTVIVTDRGSWTAGGAPPPTPAGGTVRAGAASELAAILEGGWGAVTAQTFGGTCPTAYDGSEVAYSIRRIPLGPRATTADAAVREVRSCTHDFTSAGAEVVLARLRDLWQSLGLPE